MPRALSTSLSNGREIHPHRSGAARRIRQLPAISPRFLPDHANESGHLSKENGRSQRPIPLDPIQNLRTEKPANGIPYNLPGMEKMIAEKKSQQKAGSNDNRKNRPGLDVAGIIRKLFVVHAENLEVKPATGKGEKISLYTVVACGKIPCAAAIFEKIPPFTRSSSKPPCSTNRPPFSRTRILSIERSVESRCATQTTVRCSAK